MGLLLVSVLFHVTVFLFLCQFPTVLICCCCLVTKSRLTLLQPHGVQPTRFLCPWDFPGKSTGVGCHFLLQGIFLTQGSNPCVPCLLCWQVDSWALHHLWASVCVIFRFPSITDYHELLNSVLCYTLGPRLFYTYQCVSANPKLLIHLSSSLTL